MVDKKIFPFILIFVFAVLVFAYSEDPTVYITNDKSFSLQLSREELTDDFETTKWQKKLIEKIDGFLNGITS